MKPITDLQAERRAMRERRRAKRRALQNRHYQKKRSMIRFCRKYLENAAQEAIRPRVAVVNSMDLPVDEKRRRIQMIVEQERGVWG